MCEIDRDKVGELHEQLVICVGYIKTGVVDGCTVYIFPIWLRGFGGNCVWAGLGQ